MCILLSGFAQLSNLTNLEHLYIGAGMPITDVTLTNTLAPLQRLRCVGQASHNRQTRHDTWRWHSFSKAAAAGGLWRQLGVTSGMVTHLLPCTQVAHAAGAAAGDRRRHRCAG